MQSRLGGAGGTRAALAALAALFPLSLAAQATVNESEPNGATSVADSAPVQAGGVLVRGDIVPDDRDYFAVSVAEGDLLTATVSVLSDRGAFADPLVAIFDAAGEQQGADDDAGPGLLPSTSATVGSGKAGVWFVGVSGFPNESFTGDHDESFAYQLMISTGPLVGGGGGGPAGSFDELAPGGVAVINDVLEPGEVDEHVIPVEQGRTLVVNVFDGERGAFDDPVVTVLESSDSDDDEGPGFLASLFADVAANSERTLEVRRFAERDSDTDGAFPYRLTAALLGERCDVDGNGSIDAFDVDAIFDLRGTPASGADDPADANGDGFISVQDSALCQQRCTLADCTPLPPPTPLCGLLGIEPFLALGAARWLRRRRMRLELEQEEAE